MQMVDPNPFTTPIPIINPMIEPTATSLGQCAPTTTRDNAIAVARMRRGRRSVRKWAPRIHAQANAMEARPDGKE